MESAKRIASNVGGGFVAGINAVIAGRVLAGHESGWEVIGIRDGFDGMLSPERYPNGEVSVVPPQVESSEFTLGPRFSGESNGASKLDWSVFTEEMP